MEKEPPAPAPNCSLIYGKGGGAAADGVPIADADRQPVARDSPSVPTGTLPQDPATIGAIPDDLHGLVGYGAMILCEPVADPNRLALATSLIRLEDRLSYLTSRVSSGLARRPGRPGDGASRQR